MNKKEVWNTWKKMIDVMVYTVVIILIMVLSIPAMILTGLIHALSNVATKIGPKLEKQEEESY